MTDENKDVSREEDRATLEQADVQPQDEQTAQDLPDGTEEPVQEETEADLDRTGALEEENHASSDTVVHLTSEEQELDLEIGVLLGETMENERGSEESAQEDQTAAIAEEPASPGQETAQQQEQAPTVESVLEAILFATDEPLTESKLASIVETTAKQVRESIESLNEKYKTNNNAFRIEQIAGGYQMLTLNTYNLWLKKMVRARGDNKLSPAAMETLAIIAYKQPIIRADVEAIRGVAVGEVIRSLMYKGLVKIIGRAEILGRPMLYGTTKKFLEVFGLNSLKDLPKAEELKNPDRG